MINSRAKGRAGEQEVATILRDELGMEVHRNWAQQAAIGGCDLIGIPGWGIEVKRIKKLQNGDLRLFRVFDYCIPKPIVSTSELAARLKYRSKK
jgi:hypothetical protein